MVLQLPKVCFFIFSISVMDLVRMQWGLTQCCIYCLSCSLGSSLWDCKMWKFRVFLNPIKVDFVVVQGIAPSFYRVSLQYYCLPPNKCHKYCIQFQPKGICAIFSALFLFDAFIICGIVWNLFILIN